MIKTNNLHMLYIQLKKKRKNLIYLMFKADTKCVHVCVYMYTFTLANKVAYNSCNI